MSYGFSDPSPDWPLAKAKRSHITRLGPPFILPTMAKAHTDIRWNPELREWFCASCGQTSNHAAKQNAIAELSTFDCCILGTTAKKLDEKERTLRAHYLEQQRKRKRVGNSCGTLCHP